ncbi:MAG TPA: alpha/beta hydrolase [Micropepsaceae bacterium]|jgi:acetyl esterase/lipase
MWILRFLTALLGLFGEGRSPAMMLNLVVPRSGYRLRRDLPYGPGPRQRFDLYLPETLPSPAPVLLFFYGGAFRTGRKSEYRVVGEAFASAGIIVAVADYRIYPNARFPGFLEDGAMALAAVHARAAEFGGDPNRIFLAGHSAGAYIAVMLAADPSYVRGARADPAWIRGVVGIASSYGNSPPGVVPNPVFEGRAPAQTQPGFFIDAKRPPMLLVSGAKDIAANLESARNLAAKLRAVASEVEEIVYPNPGHMGIILSLAPRFRHIAPLRDDIARFMAAH